MTGKRKVFFLLLATTFLLTIGGLLSNPTAWAQIAPEDRAINLNVLNSDASDIAPIVSADGTKLYFTSDRRGPTKGQDFYVSSRVGGEWGEPELIPELSTDQNEGPDSITVDGSTMYFTACNQKLDMSDKCDLYVTQKRSDGSWGETRALDEINTVWEEANASISPDGNTLYFASNRPEGQGGYDIWMTTKDSTGKWTEPVNCGPKINTTEWEGIAFVHPDGTKLFFSSNGRGGFGNADIFKAEILGGGDFNEAENLGGLVNTEYNDIYFTIPGSGDYAYFSSSAELPGSKGREDMYAIPIPLILASPKYVVMRGKVYDEESHQKLSAALRITGSVSQTPVTIGTDSKTGVYSIPLKLGEEYTIIANADGYFDSTTTADLANTDPYRHVIHDIPLKKLPEVASLEDGNEETSPDEMAEIFFQGGKIIVKNVEFDFDKYYIKEDFKSVLNKLATFMHENPSVVIKIDGYTDSVGTEDYNMTLSWKRARSVRSYLSSQGIGKSRLLTKGYGESNLIAEDDPQYGNQTNRRCEFSLVRGSFREPDEVSGDENLAMSGKAMPPGTVDDNRYGGVFKDYEDEEAADRAEAEIELEQAKAIEVVDGVVALAIRDHKPYYPGDVFIAPIPVLYCFTPVIGIKKETKISHVWYFGKERVSTVPLKVTSDYFRTWSKKSIPKDFVGKGYVDVIAEDGKNLARIKFEVRAAKNNSQ